MTRPSLGEMVVRVTVVRRRVSWHGGCSIARMPHPAQSPASPWRSARAQRRPVHDPPRILVAEDDPEMRRLIVEALRRDGNVVHEAQDGGRLLVELTHGLDWDYAHVDLIVSDVRMPVCSGLQIVGALRSAHCLIPIILMTAFGDEETRAHAQLLGASLFDKPFAIDDLRAAVTRLLEAERAAI